MATEFAVLLPAQHADAVEPAVAALEGLDEIEAALTIYHSDSEISRINQIADQRPVHVTPFVFGLIEKAVLWSQRTAGAFDVTAGPLVEAWGFTRRDGRKPTASEVSQALGKVGYQHLRLDAEHHTVQFSRPGMSINMGGIGKGEALDWVATRLRQAGVSDFLLHGGNSSIIAAGDQKRESGKGWAIGISHPTKPSRRLAGIWLRDAALATSGSGKQFFHHRGRRYGHVIDPRTGYPAGDLLALTVVMPSAADADACSTGFFVAGTEALPQEADWPLPDLITVAAGRRQDEAILDSVGSIEWVTAEDERDDSVSQPSGDRD